MPGLYRLVLTAVLFASFSLGSARAQSEKLDVEAQQLFEAGATAYEEGKFVEALDAFQRAYELSNRPKLLYNIGRAADSDGQAQRAVDAYKAYLLAMPRADNRSFVEARIEKLQKAPAPAETNALSPVRSESGPPPKNPLKLPIWLMITGGAGVALGTALVVDSLVTGDKELLAPAIILAVAGGGGLVTGGVLFRSRKRTRDAALKQSYEQGVGMTSLSPLLPVRPGDPVGVRARLSF